MRYLVIQRQRIDDLNDTLNGLAADGWRMVGPVACLDIDAGWFVATLQMDSLSELQNKHDKEQSGE
jgi:hypothetical protein